MNKKTNKSNVTNKTRQKSLGNCIGSGFESMETAIFGTNLTIYREFMICKKEPSSRIFVGLICNGCRKCEKNEENNNNSK